MKARIHSIDTLRGIAIILVLLCHLNDHIKNIYHFDFKVFASGWNGVYLFFVLSGYLITKSLSSVHLKKDVCTYYLKRIIRTWPLYFILIFTYFLFGYDFNNSLLYYITFTQNFLTKISPLHTWSIAVEEQIYLIAPILFFLYNKKIRFLFLFILLNILARYYTDNIRLLFSGLDSFLLGSLVFLVENLKKAKDHFTNFVFPYLILSLLIIYLPIYLNLFNTQFDFLLYTFQGIGFSLLLYLVLNSKIKFHPLIHNKVIRYIGKSSYTTYLFHPIILNSFEHENVIIFVLTFIALQSCFTYIFFELIEKRILKFNRTIQ